MIGIYKITNKLNGKSYIGQSIHCNKRYKEHCRGKKQFIDETIQLEGKENFTFELLEECTKEQLDEREDYYITKYNTMFPNGYNKRWNVINISKAVPHLSVKREKELLNKNIISGLGLNIYYLCCSYKKICESNSEEYKVISFESLRKLFHLDEKDFNDKVIRKELVLLQGQGLISFYEVSTSNSKGIKIPGFHLTDVCYKQ